MFCVTTYLAASDDFGLHFEACFVSVSRHGNDLRGDGRMFDGPWFML